MYFSSVWAYLLKGFVSFAEAQWGIERESLRKEIQKVTEQWHQAIRERDRERGTLVFGVGYIASIVIIDAEETSRQATMGSCAGGYCMFRV